MTEPPLSIGAFAAARQQPPPPLPLPGSLAPPVRYAAPKPVDPPTALVDGSAEEEDDGEIFCICAYNWDDGYTIQCETCNKWNHMECYYPNEADRPGQDQTHYCVDCQPRPVDVRRASALQRDKYNEQQLEKGNSSRRPVSKAGRKKAKESPHVGPGPVVNGWSADKHAHLHGGRERKSASPRDQPPPAKRPKTTHRSSNSVAGNGAATATSGRKRTGSTLNTQRSPSKSPGPDAVYGPVMPMCSDEFLHIADRMRTHINTDTNIWNSIDVTNSLSEWLQDPDAVERDCQQKQIDVFKRWDGPFDDMPGKPEVSLHNKYDTKFTGTGEPIIYPCITGEEEITQHTFIGELLGHVGFKSEYMDNPDGRWESLRHCEPFVFFHPKLPIFIDARQEGSVYRYVRRSCRPNAEMQTIITEGTTYHFCFMATKDIMPGEEITVGWEFDDRIRAMYAQRSHMTDSAWAPDVRNQIAMWVSNVLANCGPCACSGQGCPMAFFDRRGQAIPIDPEPAPIKPTKRKRKAATNISPNESGRNSNQASRSGSEVRKVENQDEDMTDSRSVSGSYRGSASRDITPSTHYSAAAVPELSERERKKLMREEEMFKRQEEERGKQRKKRNSGGSNLNTPSANTSRQLGHSASSKYADAGTSSRHQPISSRAPTSKRGGRQPLSSSRGASKSSVRPQPKPAYVDSAIQCDMDIDEPATQPLVTPPKRKQYVSVTQRLLRRCASNNFKRKGDGKEQDDKEQDEPKPVTLPLPVQGDTMDIDKDESPSLDANTADVLPLSPISDKVKEPEMTDLSGQAAATKRPPPLSPVANGDDAEMKDVDEEAEPAAEPSNDAEPAIKSDIASPREEQQASLTSDPPMDPPPPPWPTAAVSPTMSPEATKESPQQSQAPPPPPPQLHIPTPAPPATPSATATPSEAPQSTGAAVQSSPPATQGLAPLSIFPPAVNAALIPSPVARKKMSLSDYTKRSKAQRPESSAGASHRESSPTTSVVSADLAPREKEGLLQGSAISESPAPESVPTSSAEEKKLDVVAEEDTLEEGEMPPATFGDGGLPTTISAGADFIPNSAGTTA